MKNNQLTFWEIALKTMVIHTVTYFIMGLLAFFIFAYSTQYAETSLRLLMRQTTDPLVMAGPLFQPIQGVLFGITFYLLREVLFGKKKGLIGFWVLFSSWCYSSPCWACWWGKHNHREASSQHLFGCRSTIFGMAG